jgi:penicillin amidase
LNRGPYPTSGGEAIVNATGWDATEGFQVDWLPSMRMIVDLGEFSRSLAVHTTGQSGHAFHPHYADMVDLWCTIQYHPMRWEQAEIESSAEAHLRLNP